jgi:hypothetical protein
MAEPKQIKAIKGVANIGKKLLAEPAPAYTSKILESTTAKFADKIADANPKLTDAEVQKKALAQATKKLEWERVQKPALEKRYGPLAKASFAESNPNKMQNTAEVVAERKRKANEFLDQPTEPWTPPPKELQAFDRASIKDALEGFPDVEQSSFPRDVPTRASTSHVEEMYSDPENRALIEKQIKRGLPLGGETFYGSLYPIKQAVLEAGMPAEKFDKWIHSLAPASARNSIMNEMAVGQFLRNMNARGIPLTEENVAKEMALYKEKFGIGLPLMPIHRQGVANVLEGGQDLREMSKANIPTNYKIPTYGTQKAGDFAKSTVLDVHEAGGHTQGSRFHPYFNEQGGFGNTEYGAGEQGLLSIAKDLGIPGGMAQAGRWFGGGELTGLKSPRGDALDLLEKQVAFTLQQKGIQPNPANVRKEVLRQIETGEGDLLPWYRKEGMPDVRETGLQRAEGGEVEGPSLEERLTKAIANDMAKGGEVNSLESRLTQAIAQHNGMAEGGGAFKKLEFMAEGGKAGKFGKLAEGVATVGKKLLDSGEAAPKVDRLSMSYKDVTKRVPEVADALEQLVRGEITKAQYNDIVKLYKPVTPYTFVPKPATKDEAVGALRGDAAKERYGKQSEYEPGSKVGLRLDIPAYTGKGVWVNSIHNEKAKKVAYGPTASVKNADLSISQAESKRIALGGAKAPYARIKGEWNPMSDEEAIAKAQEYLNHPEWRQIGMDPERHSYFYDRATMQPITNAEEIIQIGPLVLGKNPKFANIDDFEYAKGGYATMLPFAKGGKIVKGGLNVAKRLMADNSLPTIERDANLAKFLEPSKVQQRLYHGTGQGDISAFKSPPRKKVPPGYMWGQKGDETYNRGVFLSPNPEMANHFAKRGTKLAEDDAGQYAVYPVRAQIERPFDYENPEHREMLAQFFQKQYDDWHKANPEAKRMPDVNMEYLLDKPDMNFQAIESPEMLHAIEKLGFDSFYTSEGKAKNIGVFDPRKIKSDIGNRGTYDINEPDLSKAHGGIAYMDKGGKVGRVASGIGKIAKRLFADEKPAPAVMKPSSKEANDLARKRASLPKDKGGLGLPPNNTAEQRAQAMGYDKDVYHGTSEDFTSFKGDQPIFTTEDPDIAKLYGKNIYPLKTRGEEMTVSDLTDEGHGHFAENLAKELGLFDEADQFKNSDKRERELINALKERGIDRLKITDMSDMGGVQTQHALPAGSENIRSRNAAFDPFRRSTAIATSMGVAAPDLMAEEVDKARGGLAMASGGSIQDNLKKIQNYSVLDQGTARKPNELGGVILAGASWMAGDEKTKLAKQLFGEDVTNTAIGGQKTSDVLNQLNIFERDGGTFAPGATVVLDIGANDIAQGVDEDTIRNNLNEIVSRLDDYGVNVILSGQPEAHSYEEAINRTDLQMDDLYSEIAASHPNVTLVDAMSGMLNQKDLMDESRFHLKDDDSKLAYLSQFANAYKGLNQEPIEIPKFTEEVTQADYPIDIPRQVEQVTQTSYPVDIPKEIEQITQVDKPTERYIPDVQVMSIPEYVEPQPSAGYSYAQQNQGLDSYYQAINDYLSQERSQDEIQAAMEQFGVSQSDIDAARGSGAGKFEESYATEQYANGGSAFKKIQFMDKGGITTSAGSFSPEELGVSANDLRVMDEKTWSNIKRNAPEVYEWAKQNVKDEASQLKTAKGAKDFALRVGASYAGAIPDFANLLLMAPDAIFGTELASEKPWFGSQQYLDAMNKAGMLGENEFPIAETVAGILTPAGLIKKGAKKVGNMRFSKETPKKRQGGLSAMAR